MRGQDGETYHIDPETGRSTPLDPDNPAHRTIIEQVNEERNAQPQTPEPNLEGTPFEPNPPANQSSPTERNEGASHSTTNQSTPVETTHQIADETYTRGQDGETYHIDPETQKATPLDPDNPAHKAIIEQIEAERSAQSQPREPTQSEFAPHATENKSAPEATRDVKSPSEPASVPEPLPLPKYTNELSFSTLEEFRDATSKQDALKPSTRYNFNGHSWITDELARPVYAGGELSVTPHGRVGKSLQTKIGNEGEHANTDVGFHLIGDQFNGPVSRLNIVQGDGVLNNGAYKALESKLKQHIENGRKIDTKIHAEYEGGSKRPSAFIVDFQVDGGKVQSVRFSNRPSEKLTSYLMNPELINLYQQLVTTVNDRIPDEWETIQVSASQEEWGLTLSLEYADAHGKITEHTPVPGAIFDIMESIYEAAGPALAWSEWVFRYNRNGKYDIDVKYPEK